MTQRRASSSSLGQLAAGPSRAASKPPQHRLPSHTAGQTQQAVVVGGCRVPHAGGRPSWPWHQCEPPPIASQNLCWLRSTWCHCAHRWEIASEGTHKGEGKATGKRWATACSKPLPWRSSPGCIAARPQPPQLPGEQPGGLGVTAPVGEHDPSGAETEGFGVIGEQDFNVT